MPLCTCDFCRFVLHIYVGWGVRGTSTCSIITWLCLLNLYTLDVLCLEPQHIKLKRAVDRDDSVSLYPSAQWKSACPTISDCLCWAGLGVAQWIPVLTWLQLSGRSFCGDLKSFSLKHLCQGCSLSFQSSTPYVYSLFPVTALQVFRKTDRVSFYCFPHL